MKKVIVLLTFTVLGMVVKKVYGQDLAIKTNIVYGSVALTPNLGLEIGLGEKSTLDLGAGYNPWNLKGSVDDNKKIVHWLGEIEYRHWFDKRFDGHFIGAHGLFTQYNIGKHKLPLLFGKDSENYRFEGYGVGGGISYGYQWILGRRWNLELNIGVGAVYLNYEKYDCDKCGDIIGRDNRIYVGPTRAAVSIIYKIKQ